MLDVVPEIGPEGQAVQRRRVPGPEGHDERDPRDARVREDPVEPPHGPRPQQRGHRAPRATRQPSEQGRHRRADPEQRGRHHHEQQVLDHVRLEPAVAQRVDRGAEGDEHDAESRRERRRAPAPKRAGMRDRRAAQPLR